MKPSKQAIAYLRQLGRKRMAQMSPEELREHQQRAAQAANEKMSPEAKRERARAGGLEKARRAREKRGESG